MQLEDMDVMQQWSFATTLSKRLHDQHTQVLDFFTAWGVSTASGALVLHPQALRRLLRFLMPDLSLAECAALQVRVCVHACVRVLRLLVFGRAPPRHSLVCERVEPSCGKT
jgi:hypothetical protein